MRHMHGAVSAWVRLPDTLGPTLAMGGTQAFDSALTVGLG